MSFRSTLYASVINYLRSHAARTPLATNQVIRADQKGTRPPLPYLTVKLLTDDQELGKDEPIDTLSDLLTVTGGAEGDEYAVTVNGEDITYTRSDTDTDADVATALAALIDAVTNIQADATDTEVAITAVTGSLTVTTSDPNLTLEVGALPTTILAGVREGSFSIQAYGETACEWLGRLSRTFVVDDVENLTIVEWLPIQNVSQLLDTKIEERASRDIRIRYGFREGVVRYLPMNTATVTASYTTAGDSDPFVVTTSVEV